LITPGNLEDDLLQLGDCDWIIEAIVENLDAKRDLWHRVETIRKPDSILSTNTSGIPLAKISAGFSPEFRRHFLGTHFFNPPRYLHLMELIPGVDTDPKILAAVEEICRSPARQRFVRTKDTPNFIANRIGSFFGGTIAKTMVEDDLSIEEVDALTGPLMDCRTPPASGCSTWSGSTFGHSSAAISTRPCPTIHGAIDSAARFRKGNDCAQVAWRQNRAGLLQARPRWRQQGNTGAGLENSRIPAPSKTALPIG